MNILSSIIGAKKEEVARMPASLPSKTVLRRSFIEALRDAKPAFIAEVKPQSPSAGHLLSLEEVPRIVHVYERSAAAISVLCDKTFFRGGYDLLSSVASMTDKPLLAKEFVIDERQIALAVANGASAILLIAAILDEEDLSSLALAAAKARCDVLLELHDEKDLEKAVRIMGMLGEDGNKHVVIGINNRDLDSLVVDLRQTEVLAPLVRKRLGNDQLTISESGLDSPLSCRRLSPFVDGFLIGTSAIRAADPDAFLFSLIESCKRA